MVSRSRFELGLVLSAAVVLALNLIVRSVVVSHLPALRVLSPPPIAAIASRSTHSSAPLPTARSVPVETLQQGTSTPATSRHTDQSMPPEASEAPVAPPLRTDAAQPPAAGKAVPAADPFLIDLNRAPAGQLAMLPGIGPTLATRIVARRTEYGPFRAVDELQRVKGIGDTRMAQLRGLVTIAAAISGPSSLEASSGSEPGGRQEEDRRGALRMPAAAQARAVAALQPGR